MRYVTVWNVYVSAIKRNEVRKVNDTELIREIKEQGIQPKHIEQLIQKHKPDRDRMIELYERYKAKQEAIPVFQHEPKNQYEDFETGGNVRRIDQFINNKLNNAFDVEIVDTRTGYLHGVPIVYKDEDDEETKLIKQFNLLNNAPDKDSELGKMAAICGYAARIIYIDVEGNERIKNVKPYNVVFLGEDISEPEYSLHYFPIKNEKTGEVVYQADFYDEQGFYHRFRGGEESMRFEQRFDSLADYNPLFGVPNNEEMIGDVERVIALIDGYDRTLSDASSEISQTRLAYLVLRGLGMDEEEIQDLQKSGAFELYDERQDVKYLTKDVNDTMIENHLDRLEKNIMRFAKSVNFNSDEFNGNVPVIGMHLKLMALENKCITFERKMTAALRYQFKVLYSIWKRKNKRTGDDLDYLNVSYSWTRNIPVNKLEEAQVLSTLNGQVSNQTRLAQSTLVEDPEQELEQMRKEDDRFNSELPIKGVEGDELE